MELQRSGNTVEPRKFSSLNYFRSSYARIGHQIGLLDSRLATDGVKSTGGGLGRAPGPSSAEQTLDSGADCHCPEARSARMFG